MKKRLLHNLGPLVGLLLFALALWVLHHALKEYHYHDVIRSMQDLPRSHLLLAVVLTILNYLALTGYDTLAFRYIQHPLPFGKIALTSFISYVFSHNIGLSILGASAMRYRLYSAWGLSTLEIAKVIAFCTLTFWLGLFTLGGLVFVLEPMGVPALLHLPFASVRPLGMILIVLVGGYLLWSTLRKAPLKIRGWEFSFPSTRLSLFQTAVSSLDWTLAGSVFYVLLPPSTTLSFPGSLGIFLLAQIAGLVSHVPGGLGVFETVVLLLLSPTIPASSVLGSLLAYRGIYYLLPLVIGAVLLGTHELLQKKEHVKWVTRIFGRWVPELVPQVLAFTTFVGGAVLLFSGATPPVGTRLAWLKDFLPLPVVEISHFLGSLAGLGLLLLARGLQQKLDAAYFLAVLFLSSGIVFSLLKGFDYEEAIILGVMLGTLIPSRPHFYRKASLISERFTPYWIVTTILVLLGSVWLGIFSHKHVEYSGELWWQFSLSGDAPRFLRATVGVISVALFFAIARLLRPAPPEPALPGMPDLERARPIIQASRKTSANLALIGDKALLFNQKGTAFLMYGAEGRSWVALGDPVGPEKEMAELVWQFRELCDRHSGWTIFYQVDRENLHLYLDLGLTLLKLGEEARVPLRTFSLEESSRKGLRHVHRRLEKEGCTFEVIPSEGIPPLLPELKNISDAWLAEKNTSEKGFSLGFFDADYLKRFPAGLVRREGKIIAFTNIWLGAEKEEISADLTRYTPGAPHSVMEYLFIQLMLCGKQEGYHWFNLGMAPLSGLENRPLAPLWSKIGAFVFRYGEHFYNFQGLREYKEKFDPEWEPKYLASPGGLLLPRIFTDIATLIAGGLKGVVSK